MDLENFWPEWKGAINLTNSPNWKREEEIRQWKELTDAAKAKTPIESFWPHKDPRPEGPKTGVGGGVGRKDDSDKLRMDLLDPLALEGLSAVLTFGAKKYAPDNWRGGIAYRRLIGALFRHGFAFLRGEDLDPESGLPHIDHLGCCWMFLSHMSKTRPDLDDRYKNAK